MTAKVLQFSRRDLERHITVRDVPYAKTLTARDYRRAYKAELLQAYAAYQASLLFVFKGHVFDSSVYRVVMHIVLDIHKMPLILDDVERALFETTMVATTRNALTEYNSSVQKIRAACYDLGGECGLEE